MCVSSLKLIYSNVYNDFTIASLVCIIINLFVNRPANINHVSKNLLIFGLCSIITE